MTVFIDPGFSVQLQQIATDLYHVMIYDFLFVNIYIVYIKDQETLASMLFN